MRILITAGPTREHLDSVRFLSNPSSGRMGYAVARAAVRRGHEVVLVSGPVALAPPAGVRLVGVTSAAEMLAACAPAFRQCDAAVFTAAVCDYRPVRRAARKLPKKRGRWRLELEATVDIAARLGARKGRRVCVGFALEDHDARAHAELKLRKKGCDAIILNGPANIGAETGAFEVLTKRGTWESWRRVSKAVAAHRIIRLLESLSRPVKREAGKR